MSTKFTGRINALRSLIELNHPIYTIPYLKTSPLGYIIAHVYQAPSHYLNQCWQGSLAHRYVTQPPWVNHPTYTQSSLVYIMVRGLVRRRAIIQTNDDRANWYMNAPISSIGGDTIYIYSLRWVMQWLGHRLGFKPIPKPTFNNSLARLAQSTQASDCTWTGTDRYHATCRHGYHDLVTVCHG